MLSQQDRELDTLLDLEKQVMNRKAELLREKEQYKSSVSLTKKSEGI